MTADGNHWVFAYGSLMWQPGFTHRRALPATLLGYHRALCVKSVIYRGTAAAPGLVLGLSPGGECRGMAFAVAADGWAEVQDYLRAREQVTRVYREVMVPVTLDGPAERVEALTFVAEPTHPQYAGDLAEDAVVRMVREAKGTAGTARDYLMTTLQHLRSLNIEDAALERVASLL